jgi:hypothetical protein
VALTITLWIWTLLVAFAAGVRDDTTYFVAPPSGARANLSLFGVATATLEARNGAVVEWVVHPGGVAVALLTAAASLAFATYVARALQRLFVTRGRAASWISGGALIVVALACVAATAFSKWYWGYWIARPEPAAAWWKVKAVHELSFVRCDREAKPVRCTIDGSHIVAAAIRHCAKDPYECAGDRLPAALHRARLLSPRPRAVASDVLRRVERALADDRVVAKQQPPYRGNALLGGWIARGSAAGGSPVIAATLSGGEVSNDHHPVYELALDGVGRVVRRRMFFYDVAGLEGTEFEVLAPVLAGWALLVWVPLGLAGTMLAEACARVASRHNRPDDNRPLTTDNQQQTTSNHP